MTVATRLLLAASLCFAPLAWAAAQDQTHDDQRRQQEQQEQQEKKKEQQQHKQQPQQPQPHTQQPHPQPPSQGSAAPQGQRTGGGSGSAPQRQHPAQNNPPPHPPTGATASPTPPSQGHPQGAARSNPGPTTGATQQQSQPQPSVQRGGAPGSRPAPRVQSSPPSSTLTTTTRNTQSGATRGGSTATFSAHHSGAQPAQFDRGRFYGRDYAHFTTHDRDLWRRGAWHHEFRDGRYGWWYAVDGIWYFYTAPIYPYPTFVPDIVYIPEEEYEAPAPAYVVAPPAYYYYFCPNTQTYYPYVSSCASPWQPVPAIPPQ